MPEDELRTLVVRLIVEGRIEGGRITVVNDESVLEVPSKLERAASCASSAHYDAIRNWLNAANKLSEMCSAMVASLPASEKDTEEDGRARQQHPRRAGQAGHYQRHYEGAPRRYQGGRTRQQPAESSASEVVPSPSSATSVDDDGDIGRGGSACGCRAGGIETWSVELALLRPHFAMVRPQTVLRPPPEIARVVMPCERLPSCLPEDVVVPPDFRRGPSVAAVGNGEVIGSHRVFKPRGATQLERRRRALQEQRARSREERLEELRQIAQVTEADDNDKIEIGMPLAEEEVAEDHDAEMGREDEQKAVKKKGKQRRKVKRFRFWANQLMYPDWMVEVPEDLSTQWLVKVRPEGKHCLLIIHAGTATLRSKNGRFYWSYYVGPEFAGMGLTVLDVVYPDTTPGFRRAMYAPPVFACLGGLMDDLLRFVMDVIIWNHSELTSADAECRHYWLKSRLEDMNSRREDLFGGDSSMMAMDAGGDDDDSMLPDLVYVPAFDATPETITSLYNGEHDGIDYQPDSFIFMHKQGLYWQGLTPL
ncbi:hypothetical protein FOZ63_032461, partial [Perkinsus olseni]